MSDLTLAGHILQPTSGGGTELRPGVLEVRDGRIVSVQFGAIFSRAGLGGPDCLITPGFVDPHVHLPQFDSIGVAGMPLLQWLERAIFPAEIRWNAPDFAKAMIDRVIRQCLAAGTVAVGAYATVSHSATLDALERFRSVGFSGVIGQVMMDRAAPEPLLRSAGQLVDEVHETLERFPPHGRLAAAVTPRFAISCSPSLLEQAGQLAASHRASIQTHLAETQSECREVESRFGGKSYVEVYRQAGLLGERSLLAHGIHLDPPSQQRLAETSSTIVHCPTANSFLGSGRMDRQSHLNHGIAVALGSDVGAGYERSMVRVARAMLETPWQLHRLRQGDVAAEPGAAFPEAAPTASQAWYQITAGNADRLGLRQVGRIELGASADLLVIRPDLPWLTTPDPLSTLLFAWDDRWIQQTLLRGRVLYRPRSGSDAPGGAVP